MDSKIIQCLQMDISWNLYYFVGSKICCSISWCMWRPPVSDPNNYFLYIWGMLFKSNSL